jgi:hypothetical protein
MYSSPTETAAVSYHPQPSYYSTNMSSPMQQQHAHAPRFHPNQPSRQQQYYVVVQPDPSHHPRHQQHFIHQQHSRGGPMAARAPVVSTSTSSSSSPSLPYVLADTNPSASNDAEAATHGNSEILKENNQNMTTRPSDHFGSSSDNDCNKPVAAPVSSSSSSSSRPKSVRTVAKMKNSTPLCKSTAVRTTSTTNINKRKKKDEARSSPTPSIAIGNSMSSVNNGGRRSFELPCASAYPYPVNVGKDVVSGKGGKVQQFNRHFRNMVANAYPRYDQTTSKIAKRKIGQQIHDEIVIKLGGRFLDANGRAMVEHAAICKIMKALKDAKTWTSDAKRKARDDRIQKEHQQQREGVSTNSNGNTNKKTSHSTWWLDDDTNNAEQDVVTEPSGKRQKLQGVATAKKQSSTNDNERHNHAASPSPSSTASLTSSDSVKGQQQHHQQQQQQPPSVVCVGLDTLGMISSNKRQQTNAAVLKGKSCSSKRISSNAEFLHPPTSDAASALLSPLEESLIKKGSRGLDLLTRAIAHTSSDENAGAGEEN